MEHLPVILVMTAVLALLFGVPYLLEKAFRPVLLRIKPIRLRSSIN